MPIVEEVDSGIEAMSASGSREDSPSHKKEKDQKVASVDEEEDVDETLAERLWGLTEMFPESLRNLTSALAHGSVSGVKSLYSVSRSALWIFFASSAILFAPVAFEVERMHIQEAQRQQQRQLLLGPSAAASGSSVPNFGMPMPLPPHMAAPQR